MKKPIYSIGIDLGTTNCALAAIRLDDDNAACALLDIPQMTSATAREARPLLPSFLYLPTEVECAAGTLSALTLRKTPGVAGHFARAQSAEVPTRTVAAAKSWLCHSRVDRHEAILPWNAPAEVPKISPVEASALYLRHLVEAWNERWPEAPFREQQVTLTVPASFDASARELTREAAALAGFPTDFILLEEPQAALYAWLADRGDHWRRDVKVGDRLLVCDIGGGTTDFTLIGVEERDGELELARLAVGNHILVGGDNMDLALAFAAQALFKEKGHELDAWQSVSLWHACRAAKEALLTPGGPDRHPVTILGRGTKLVGGTVSVDLTRDQVEQVLLDGFLPACALTDGPVKRPASGFKQLGLPYESDPAISRHLARFLSEQGGLEHRDIRPSHIVFNGGVFKAPALKSRLRDILGAWFPEAGAPEALAGKEDLDFAVARGAAYYGRVKECGGMRIRGGTARAYYIGLETAGLAVPGAPRPLQALCVVPRGMEEGTSLKVPGEEIGLVVGEPVRFRFFSSVQRGDDQPGAVLTAWCEDELEETDSLEAELPAAGASEGGYVPVRIETNITELGVLEIWCASTMSDERWKLEFSVRDE
ncbi:MAG TPA: Hsp70 family protein [Kiritimatiellia bacterium]|nr:Hsp70 family protein [Kiritimatiellia bacterium]HMP00245.1 Hsp70 family protein [Kiritimatiellia bacterium]HMP96859.1 Hsp70 family protein [Kiritimatiellia bacterium]